MDVNLKNAGDFAGRGPARAKAWKGILTFLGLTCALSTVPYAWIITGGGLQAGRGAAVVALMWAPGLSALITSWGRERSFRGIGWRLGPRIHLACGYFLPLLYAGAVYLPLWLSGATGIDDGLTRQVAERFGWTSRTPLAGILLLLMINGSVGMAGSLVTALGEEIGWRGYLVPQLAKVTSFPRVATWSGCIWAIWHYPAILFADYRGDSPAWLSLICFTVMVLGISLAFSWLRLMSGSVWTAAVLHASHNVFIQSFFDRLNRGRVELRWVTGEFGVGLAVTGAITGLIFWTLRNRLPGKTALEPGD